MCATSGAQTATLPEHLSSPPVFSWIGVTRSLVLCACFVDRCLSFFFWPLCCLSFIDLQILINLWYLQTLHLVMFQKIYILGSGVVTTRAHVHYVVTEYGIAYLFGKNIRQRAYHLNKINLR
jgi:hypothetical protein